MNERDIFGTKSHAPQISAEELARLRLFRDCSTEIAKQVCERLNTHPLYRCFELEPSATANGGTIAININARYGLIGPFAQWRTAAKMIFKDDRDADKFVLSVESALGTPIYSGSIAPKDIGDGPISFGAMIISRSADILEQSFRSTPCLAKLMR